MFFTPDPEFTANPDQLAEVDQFFSGYDLISISDLKSQLEMGAPPDKKTIATMTIMTYATASATFKDFTDTYNLGKDNDEYAPVVYQSVAYDIQEGINRAYKALSSDVDVALDGPDILDWIKGEGREPTKEDIMGLIEVFFLLEKVMGPMRDVVESLVRPDDDFGGHLFAYTVWSHYMKDILDECQCEYTQAAFEGGIDLEPVREEFDHVLDRLGTDSKKMDMLSQNDSSLEDTVQDVDVSSDLKDMMSDAGSMMN